MTHSPSDDIPDPTWENPIWYKKKWRIYFGDFDLNYAYCHDDYDGAEDANDHRHGYASTIDEARAAIDAYEEDHK